MKVLQAPVVEVAEAVLHEGRLDVRRSPLLELRVVDTDGLTRTDLSTAAEENSSRVESPLGIRPFQAYRFTRTPFRLELSVVPSPLQLTAEIQTLLQWSLVERSLESRVIFQGSGRPIYAMTLAIPPQLTVEGVQLVGDDNSASPDAKMRGPVDCQWAVDSDDGSPRLRVFLIEGQLGTFSLLIRGSLEGGAAANTMELPRITVEQVDRQETTIVIRTDPGFDSRVDTLQGLSDGFAATGVRLAQARPAQIGAVGDPLPRRRLCGPIAFGAAPLRVSCQTISNLAVTNRTFEETILLDFMIEDGGIGEVAFLLPEALRGARIQAPLIRQKSVEETDDPAWVRVRLELQDDMVMDQYRVLIEMDRVLDSDPHAVPIPRVETGVTTRRFVALETRGREEVEMEPFGLEPLSREQRAWRPLAEMLGEEIHQAFLVQPSAENPRLTVRTKDREVVETAGARILLAETVLTLDASGAYRGVFTCHVDNRTEQFLELILPDGARLWTAHVAGKPVKPITGSDNVRIPIVKTAEGDLDYEVVLKYGGRMDLIGRYDRVEFPLMRSREIQVEESQVRVFLPDTHKWFGFDGTMGIAAESGDLWAGYLKYKTQQIRTATENLTSANPYTRLRARSNLVQLGRKIEQLQQLPDHYSIESTGILAERAGNESQRVARGTAATGSAATGRAGHPLSGNRKQLGDLYFQQSTEVGRNAVNTQGANFESLDLSAAMGREWRTRNRRTRSQRARSSWAKSRPSGSARPDWAQCPIPGMGDRSRRDHCCTRKTAAPMDEARPSRELSKRKPRVRHLTLPRKRNSNGSNSKPSEISRGEQGEQAEGRPESKLERFRNQLESGAVEEDDSAVGSQLSYVEGESPVDGVPRQPSSAAFSSDGRCKRAVGQPGDLHQLGMAGQMPSGPAATPSTGLASLDIEFPLRGTEYRFTTPGGDTNIAGRAIERPLLSRSMRLLAVTLVLALVGVIYPRVRRSSIDAVLNRGVCLLLIFAGLMLVLLAPWIGLAALLIGSLQFARLTWLRRTA